MLDFFELSRQYGDLPTERAGRRAPADLIARRAAGGVIADQPRHADVEVTEATLAGVNCTICRPRHRRGSLVHFHGGAFRSGTAGAWASFGTRLSAATGREVVLPDYSLAPERPFPAALRDAFAVVQEVGRHENSLALSGDSAGGGLAISATLMAQAAGVSIASVVLFSPWLDLTVSSDSYQSCAATDLLFSKASAAEAAEAYLQGCSPKHPLASPIFADLTTVPAILAFVSASEVLRDDSLGFAARLAAANRPVELHVLPHQPHVWPVLEPESEASKSALEIMAMFLERAGSKPFVASQSLETRAGT